MSCFLPQISEFSIKNTFIIIDLTQEGEKMNCNCTTPEGVITGYYGLFKPPFSILDPIVGGTLYVVTTRLRNILIIIPLVPNFFVDVVKIMKRIPSRNIVFIVPDIGPRFISDYINSWYYIKKILGYECKLFSMYLPEGTMSEEFLHDIDRSYSASKAFEIMRTRQEVVTINVQFLKAFSNNAAPWASDIILHDTGSRKFFISEMNEQKLNHMWKIRDTYDELHMAYIDGNYPSMTYNEVLKKYPLLVQKIIVNQFNSKDEYDTAQSFRVHIGKLVNL